METKEFQMIISALALHERRLEGIAATLDEMKADIGSVKVRAGLWGSLAAFVVMLVKSVTG